MGPHDFSVDGTMDNSSPTPPKRNRDSPASSSHDEKIAVHPRILSGDVTMDDSPRTPPAPPKSLKRNRDSPPASHGVRPAKKTKLTEAEERRLRERLAKLNARLKVVQKQDREKRERER